MTLQRMRELLRFLPGVPEIKLLLAHQERGGRKYLPPEGWAKLALAVKDKYAGGKVEQPLVARLSNR